MFWVCSKVCGPSCGHSSHRMSIFEWYVARILVKNKHRKKTLHDEIGLCVENHTCSIVNTFGRAYVIT